MEAHSFGFQYRKRYEVTCDRTQNSLRRLTHWRFNTASGMRSHATRTSIATWKATAKFQYRKRYEVTCDKSV